MLAHFVKVALLVALHYPYLVEKQLARIGAEVAPAQASHVASLRAIPSATGQAMTSTGELYFEKCAPARPNRPDRNYRQRPGSNPAPGFQRHRRRGGHA